MIPEKLTAAQEIKAATECVSKANELAAKHPLMMRMDHDPEAETTTFHFKDRSQLIIEPYLIEAN